MGISLTYHPLLHPTQANPVAPIVSPMRFPADLSPADPEIEDTPPMPPKESTADRLYDLLVDNGERLQTSFDKLSEKVDKQGQRTFLLCGLLVLGMLATSGASLYIQYTKATGITVDTAH